MLLHTCIELKPKLSGCRIYFARYVTLVSLLLLLNFKSQNADFEYGGEGDWGTGFGLAYIYLDDMFSPVITTPLNLGKTLNLDNGRAWVGLTAATGDAHWQAHDILQWQFRSLFVDEAYTPPLVVNGAGAYECANLTHCVHSPDYDHYMRTNNVWGKGHDSSEDWMSGTGGYCAFC